MWSSTTTTSSTLSPHCLANMPIVAEPHPTLMRSSSLPLMIGGLPACTITLAPPSTTSSTTLPLQRLSRVSQVTRPSFLPPWVRWLTPPRESICEPYSPVVIWPTGSPSARTVAHSEPIWRSVSILSLTPQ